MKHSRVVFVDAQTTGMRPPAAHLLELAWQAGDTDVQSHLVQLPEGVSIPKRVGAITGLSDGDLSEGTAPADLAFHLHEALQNADAAVIHYAQFEKPFLLDLYKRFLDCEQLPVPVICTYQLTQRLFPNLPSQNIRATAGYFGPAVTGLNRAGVFVRATAQIWQGLLPELEKLQLTDARAVLDWIAKAPRAKAKRYEYRLEKLKRLELPDSPGIYRMLGKNGEVLYVGKATSLRDRVNSYFRGMKGREKRKLEMMAQVWDLEVTPCPSPLEAALLESDEIKRLNPPYNVVLKAGKRQLVFYRRDFSESRNAHSEEFPLGPFRLNSAVESLREIAVSFAAGQATQIFWDELPEADLVAGFELFCATGGLKPEQLRSVRTQMAYGMKLYRQFLKEKKESEAETETEAVSVSEAVTDSESVSATDTDTDTDTATDSEPVTVEDIASRFSSLLTQAAAEHHRSKKLTRLLEARVRVGERILQFQNGQLGRTPVKKQKAKWAGLDIDTFDRMSVLLTELSRKDHRIILD